MRIFGNNKVLDWVLKKGLADDEAIVHRWLNKALETAQGKVEARNFEIRKQKGGKERRIVMGRMGDSRSYKKKEHLRASSYRRI